MVLLMLILQKEYLCITVCKSELWGSPAMQLRKELQIFLPQVAER